MITAAERMIAGQPGRSRRVVNAALALFEWSTIPRARFSRLSPDRRARQIAAMERSRLRLRRDLALLVKATVGFAYGRDPEVTAALGARIHCVRGPGVDDPRWDPPAPPLERASLQAGEGVERCDVVIVGSGAGGGAAARVLSEAGLGVIVLEQGPFVDAGDYSEDPLDSISTIYRDGGVTVCGTRPPIPVPVGRCVGGTTVVNSGTCFPTPGDVLFDWRERFGIHWASDLDAEFEAVERALHIQPVDRDNCGRNGQLCAEGAELLGASHGPIPRNAGHVSCCSSCPMGCPIDAKQATHVSELPRAARAGARVRERAKVTEVIVEGGRAVGVKGIAGPDREPYEVRARAVVVAAGAFGTAELLLAQGIANGSGELGRHLRIHPVCWVGGLFDEQVDGWDGVMQSWFVDEWSDRGVMLEATFTPPPFALHWLRGAGEEFTARIERFGRLGMVGVQFADTSEGRVRVRRGRSRISYELSRADAAAIRFGIARAAQVLFAAGATEAYPQLGRLGAIMPGQETVTIENGRFAPADLRLEAFHPMGTARMGADPAKAVVAPSGECHDLAGLYVADASLFPTATRVNPMVTIMACARHIAGELAETLA